jgi:hypothetical protein
MYNIRGNWGKKNLLAPGFSGGEKLSTMGKSFSQY